MASPTTLKRPRLADVLPIAMRLQAAIDDVEAVATASDERRQHDDTEKPWPVNADALAAIAAVRAYAAGYVRDMQRLIAQVDDSMMGLAALHLERAAERAEHLAKGGGS